MEEGGLRAAPDGRRADDRKRFLRWTLRGVCFSSEKGSMLRYFVDHVWFYFRCLFGEVSGFSFRVVWEAKAREEKRTA